MRLRIISFTAAFVLLALTGLASPCSAQEKQADVSQLIPGKTIEREISGGEMQSFLVTLKQGQFLRAVATSHDIDVVATLFGPDDQKLLRVDLLKYPSPEPVSFEAEKAGEYKLEIRADAAPIVHGHYKLASEVKPQVDESDKQRLIAERLLIEANDLEREGSKELLHKSIDKRSEALALWRKLGDRYWEAYSLHYSGRACWTLKKNPEALAFFSQALSVRKGLGDRFGEVATLNNFGIFYADLGETEEALEHFNQAVTISRAIGDPMGEARTLSNLANVFDSAGDRKKALQFYNQALALRRAIGDKGGEANTLIKLGNASYALGENLKALEFYNEALPLKRAVVDRSGEADTVRNLGIVYEALGQKPKAVELFSQALALRRDGGDKVGEAVVLNDLGIIYYNLGENQQALEFYNQGLALKRVLGDKSGEGDMLISLGIVYSALGEKPKALVCFNQALPLMRALGDKSGEANTLMNLGNVYSELAESQQALEFFNQALALKRALGDKSGEGNVLFNIGIVYFVLGEKQKALAYFTQTLSLRRALDDKRGQANALKSIGNIYSDLGEKQKAIEVYNQVLPVERANGDRSREANTLNGIGLAYAELGEKQKALEYYNQALLLERAVVDKSGEANTLINLGNAYSELGEKQKALELYKQALPLKQTVGDKWGEATVLVNVGSIYAAIGENRKALDLYNQALPLQRRVGDLESSALMSANLMEMWVALSKPGLAIFYGKQAINNYQQLRGNIQGIEKETQRTFLRTLEGVYKRLAELLITENRLDEATQVINLLRDQEFFDFNRDASQQPGQTALSARESASLLTLDAALAKVVNAQQPLTTFKRSLDNHQPTAAEPAELKRLEGESDKATADFQATLRAIEADFNQPPSSKDKVEIVQDIADMKVALRELGRSTKQKAAALYTLIGEDKFHIILIQPDGELKSFESPIKAADLNKRLLQFYALLQSPTYDPRPLGKEVYDIIFKPIEGELKKAGVQTLMWQLDGNLRYVPMAALYDGEKYLVERFQNVVFTRADKERMTRAVSANWTGTGFGSSQAHTVDLLGDGAKVNFDALPGVTAELASIFRLQQPHSMANRTPGAKPDLKGGILEGEVFTDAQFTRSAFYEAAKQRRPLIHISSHFSFRPGDDSRSFLLLGDGTALTLNELKKQTRLFDGVELLTLSACNTAVQQANADGREIDGFAELAQRLGAGSVMATLWPVADNSTPWLMREFYQTRQSGAGLTKANGLRQAQLALLNGNAQTQPLPEAQKGSSLLQVVVSKKGERDTANTRSETVVRVDEKDAPRFPRSEQKPFAHPYYWAPFILIGNWK